MLQKEIKNLLAKMDWSIYKLAEVIYVTKYDDDESVDQAKAVKSFEGALKKKLNRKTTKKQLLEEYLTIISNHDDFGKLGLVIPHYGGTSILSETMETGMKNISEMISHLAKNK